MKHILAIDFEDWHQLAARRISGRLLPATENIFRQTDVLLQFLDDHDTKATFFILGMLVEEYPELAKRIASAGHEIACHGYAHLNLSRMTREEFARDTLRAVRLIEDICGDRPRGYRAAEFSIRQSNLWALDVLAEMGFEYDSSIFPIWHRRYGIPNFFRDPGRYSLPSGLNIVELPLATASVRGVPVPVAGGGYFRYLPLSVLASCVESSDHKGLPFVTYFHPYEFDPQFLSCSDLLPSAGWKERLGFLRFSMLQNVGRSTVSAKLAGLMEKYRFTTCRDYLGETEINECRTLLSTHC